MQSMQFISFSVVDLAILDPGFGIMDYEVLLLEQSVNNMNVSKEPSSHIHLIHHLHNIPFATLLNSQTAIFTTFHLK